MKSFFFRLFLIIFLAIPIYLYRDYFLKLEVFPGRDTMKKSQTFHNDDPYLNSLKNKLTDLELNEIFWKQRIKTKIPDAYTLVISLLDSSVWLDINGVSIHKSNIVSFQISDDLKLKRESAEISSWLIKSFYVVEEWATVPKEPIRTKDITGTRNDLDSLDFRPFSLDSTDIMVVLMYSENLRIGLKQGGLHSDNRVLLEKQEIKKHGSETILTPTDIKMSYNNLLQEEWISIEISRLDVIAIYRALKIKSQLIIGL